MEWQWELMNVSWPLKKNLDCFSDLQATGSEFLGRKGDKTKPICDLKQ